MVIKGMETKSFQGGWMGHDRYRNSWRNVDQQRMMGLVRMMGNRHETESIIL